jgi:hypothetical protein
MRIHSVKLFRERYFNWDKDFSHDGMLYKADPAKTNMSTNVTKQCQPLGIGPGPWRWALLFLFLFTAILDGTPLSTE